MTIEELLEQCIQKNLIDLTISGLKKKNEELPVKIKVRPVAMKDKIEYQVSEFIGRKVFHKNYKKDELKKKITDWMQEDYKQAQFTMTDATAQILSVLSLQKDSLKLQKPKVLTQFATAVQARVTIRFVLNLLSRDRKSVV